MERQMDDLDSPSRRCTGIRFASTIRDQQLAQKQATAFVSIMRMQHACTFCIVPQTRGAERSRSIDDIVREVRDLVSRGVKEITLSDKL